MNIKLANNEPLNVSKGSGTARDISNAYIKPSSGIPASDLADGIVMNVVEYDENYTPTQMDAANFCHMQLTIEAEDNSYFEIDTLLPRSSNCYSEDYTFCGVVTPIEQAGYTQMCS